MMTTMRRRLARGFLLVVASFSSACTTTDHVAGLPRLLNALTVRSITATDLGILPGHVGGSALDVNRSGQAVGVSFISISLKGLGPPQPVLWDASGPVALAENGGQALAVNDAGVVVGYVGSNAMLWGNGVPLEVFSDRFTVAMDVAMDGRVVGTMGSPSGPELATAAFWQTGRISKLELPLGSDYVYEVHINDAGQIIAGVWNAKDKSVRSFLIDANGATDLGSLGGPATWAHAINATGQIVGTSLTAKGEAHAFLWEGGQMRDLGGLGGSWSHAWGINSHGEVVGESALPGDLEWHAVAWVNHELNDLGALASYPNGAAHAINDVGQAVGSSYALGKCEPTQVVDRGPPLLPGPACYGAPRPTMWTLELANTASGSDITVTPVDATTGQPSPVGVTFSEVTGSGTTTVQSGTVGGGGGPPAPGNFRLGSPPTYYDIQTTASVTPPITVCITWTEGTYNNERKLRLLHQLADHSWPDVTLPGYPDTQNNKICGDVTSLSPFLVAEQNVAPVVSALTLPGPLTPLGTAVGVSASFTDENPGDVHSANIDWDDGSSSAGAVSESHGTGTVAGSHLYAAAGVYTVTVTVRDGDLSASLSSALSVPAYVVVYDPSAGFATGGGWITSPAGAYAPNPALGGKASFGFVAKYLKGATNPTGNTEFQFQEGNLAFQSTSYQWLVVAGAKAQFKGDGAINGGTTVYGFLLTAIDGQLYGGGGADRFRLKIWDKSTDAVIYDNQRGAAEDGDAATLLGGGSIVIHK